MSDLRFEWDEAKAATNLRRHQPGPRLRPNETSLKKPETETKPTVTRGKYANLLKQGTNLVILDPALMPFFPDSASVNRALHAFLAINDQVQSATVRARARRRAATSATPEFDPRVGIQPRQASR